MLRRAVVLVLAVCSTFVLAVGPTYADAPPGSNNCAGVFVSALTPGFTATAPPSFGRSRSELARTGVIGEMEKAATDALASCGAP